LSNLNANGRNVTIADNQGQGTIANDDKSTFKKTIIGGSGNDNLIGSEGVDYILGRGGNDTLTGGNGGDSFVFNNITEGIDTITDFGGGDRIEISASGFGGNLTANAVLDQSQFVLGSAASNINHRFIYNNSTGDLFFDPDGIGTIAQQKLAILTGAPSLSAIDIFVFT
jgi:Ca2+-binding RTX toxin-like protein